MFAVDSWQQNWIFLTTHQDISSPVSGNKTGYFWPEIETLRAVIVATKSNILDKMLWYFPAVIMTTELEMSGHFQLSLWKQNRTFVMRGQDILSPVSGNKKGIFDEDIFCKMWGHFQPCLWRQNLIFLMRCQEIVQLFLATKSDMFSGDVAKTGHLWWEVKTF